MLKPRIIPTLLYKDHGLVKGIGFDSWRRVGTTIPAVKVYNRRGVDELILLDIAATPEKRMIDLDEIDRLADECFMPLTIGGGIRTLQDIRAVLRAGADKVAVNTAVFENPALIKEAVAEFGSQCVVVSIDVKQPSPGQYEVFTHCGVRPTGRHPAEWARKVAELGAGEILLTSVERDGSMMGYDISLIKEVSGSVSIPVIASGGAGKYHDFYEALSEGGASAAAAASIFHFTELTPLGVKNYLKERGLPVRQ